MQIPALVILDCDGVLVDSELLASRVELAELQDCGCSISLRDYLSAALGRSEEDAVWRGIAAASGVTLPPGFAETLRSKVAQCFEDSLQPIPGVAGALSALPFPKCVASGSSPPRLLRTLELTGLLGFFDGNIFSAVEVTRGKPHPDLFLYAASRMGVPAKNCLVVEDSPAGVRAGTAAGMTVLGFTGGSHCDPSLPEQLRELGCLKVFDDMRKLPALCQSLCDP